MPASHPPRTVRTGETVLARLLVHRLELAVAEGMNRAALLDTVGLREGDLVDPDARVPLSVDVALWALLSKRLTDPGFGVRAGASFRPRDAGLVGYVMSFSPTLDSALRRFERFYRILGGAVRYRLEIGPEGCVAIVECDPALGESLPIAVDYRLAACLSGCRQITGVDLAPTEVAFTYVQPRNTLEHRRFFRCPLRFEQSLSRLVYRQPDLALPVPRADETLADYLSDYAEQKLRSLTSGTEERHRVRAAIWARLGEGRPTLARIAADLHLAPRTLQRHLASEGTSFIAEVDDIRKAMAVAALKDRSVSVEEVAFVLGYTEPSTFFRSFKRWTGTTPARFRHAAA